MADRARDLEISVLSNADKFDLDGPARDLEDLGDKAKDFGRALDDMGDDGKRTLDRLADDGQDAARKLDRAFDAISKSGKHNLRDKLDDSADKAKDSLRDVRDEASDTGREMAASFSGSADDIMGALQELGANAGVAFGPVGGALSIALGVGLGAFFADWQKKKEKLEEDVESFTSALVEGSGRLSEEFLNQQITAIDPKELKELADAAADANLSVRDVIRAYAGDPEAIDAVNTKIQEAAQALRDSGISGSEADPALAAYGAAVAKVSDKLDITTEALGRSKTAYELMQEAMSNPVVPRVDGSSAEADARATAARVQAELSGRITIPVKLASLTPQMRVAIAEAQDYARRHPVYATVRTTAPGHTRDVP